MSSFKLYRTNWIPRLGHAFAIVTFERPTALYPATERFVVIPTKPPHIEPMRHEYDGVAPDVMSDDQLINEQFETAKGAVSDYLHNHRTNFSPEGLYYDVVASLTWHEIDPVWLVHYNLTNRIPSHLAPALEKIYNGTHNNALLDFLSGLRRQGRNMSVTITGENQEGVIADAKGSRGTSLEKNLPAIVG
jgi:hypothetical protein